MRTRIRPASGEAEVRSAGLPEASNVAVQGEDERAKNGGRNLDRHSHRTANREHLKEGTMEKVN
jgi:hypothetical protein